MRILWLPHHNWQFIRRGQREYRLAHAIRDVHEVEFLSWLEVRTRPAQALAALRRRTTYDDGIVVHQARRVPNVFGQRVHEKSVRGLPVNEFLYRRAVTDLVRRRGIDVLICGISHQSVGLPPADLDVPVVFDYLDFKLEPWPDVEAEYMRIADAVLCTSRVLVERTRLAHPFAYYLPNGVDLDAAATADATEVRRKYDIGDSKVISLIGITASKRLFYVDAIAAAARAVGDVVFLLVGDRSDGARLGDAIVERAEGLGVRTIATGPVDPRDVAGFFAATDVGLYPTEQGPYFDAACPLKILEYTAAGKPVVATDLAELRNLAFPNLRLTAPTEEDFARELHAALVEPPPPPAPTLVEFSWPRLRERMLLILDEVAERGRVDSAARGVIRRPTR
jgi:glycosyltransferase involved in cell wall biosynthesis